MFQNLNGNKIPGDNDAAGLATTLFEPLTKTAVGQETQLASRKASSASSWGVLISTSSGATRFTSGR